MYAPCQTVLASAGACAADITAEKLGSVLHFAINGETIAMDVSSLPGGAIARYNRSITAATSRSSSWTSPPPRRPRR